MVKPRANITDQACGQLKKYNLPIVAEIKDRVSYTNRFLTGGVQSSGDDIAKKEIEALTIEILELLWVKIHLFDKLKEVKSNGGPKQRVVPIKANKRDGEQSYTLWLDKELIKILKIKAIEDIQR